MIMMKGCYYMEIEIKQCKSEALPQLKEVAIETYTDTFAEHNTPENMQAYLEEAFDDKQLASELLHPHSEFYFIHVQEKLSGYLKINIEDAQSEEMGEETLEIERIYIRPEFQRSGLGEHLFNKAIERATIYGKTAVWLGVWERNHRALSFYEKMGFVRVGVHSFWMGSDEQIDYILKKEI